MPPPRELDSSKSRNGQLSAAIQCPYHAWTYALDGRLLGAPHMDETPGFNKAEYPLNPVQLGLWEGFIFLNLGEMHSASLEKWFEPLGGKFSHWNMSTLHSAKRIEYDVRANWKLMFENYSECYHCLGVHPELSKISPYDSAENDLTEGPFLGGFMRIARDKSLTMSGNARARLCSVGKIRRREILQHACFLLLDLSEHAAEFASRLRNGASTLAAVAGADADLVRLVFPPGRIQA